MRTLIENRDCIINHDFKPLRTVENGQMVMCKNTVDSIIIYQDEHDDNGRYLCTRKVTIDKFLLKDIISTIDVIESEQKEMEYQDGFTF